MTSLTLAAAVPARVDALVVGVTPSGSAGAAGPAGKAGRGRRGAAASTTGVSLAPGAEAVDALVDGRLAQLVTALGGTGAAGEVVRGPVAGQGTSAAVIVAVGLGTADAATAATGAALEALRRAAGEATRALAGQARVALALPASSAEQVAAVAEGALLGAYTFTQFRGLTGEQQKNPPEAVTVVTELARDKAAKAAAERAQVLTDAVSLTRNLINTPPSHLHPKEMAEAANAAAADLPVEVTVLDERALKRGGYGGLIGVGQGSTNPPRLIKLAYTPRNAKAHLAFVGKGITFDSGGLSLKPPASMETMKSDMSGAAAVIAAVTAIARLGLPVRVTGYAACAENMPSGSAMRPSDVITIRGGRTVEVLNTDAEGRLVLADALVDAANEQPDAIVDVATLTGAQVVALGSRTSAVMANHDGFRDQVRQAAERAGEAFWPMPLPDELRKSLDSQVADIANMGDRFGGMLVAGLFLREFVPSEIPWAHLDIAGPAFNEGSAYGYTPKGGTGHAVRTLVALAEDAAAGDLAQDRTGRQ
ncbi:MAG: leucyl aminopeptidase [Actinomycetales bacterium]